MLCARACRAAVAGLVRAGGWGFCERLLPGFRAELARLSVLKPMLEPTFTLCVVVLPSRRTGFCRAVCG